jgi:hypothetical protein
VIDNWAANVFTDDEEVETEVRKWLRQQLKDFYAAGFVIFVTCFSGHNCGKHADDDLGLENLV